MPFTTWTALRDSLLDAIADGTWMQKSFKYNGKEIEFRSVAEIERFLGSLEQKAATESGVNFGRTYAKGGGLF